jgi:hypothetical protein
VNNPGSLAIFAAIRRAFSSQLGGRACLQNNTGELFAPFNGVWVACHFRAHLP